MAVGAGRRIRGVHPFYAGATITCTFAMDCLLGLSRRRHTSLAGLMRMLYDASQRRDNKARTLRYRSHTGHHARFAQIVRRPCGGRFEYRLLNKLGLDPDTRIAAALGYDSRARDALSLFQLLGDAANQYPFTDASGDGGAGGLGVEAVISGGPQ